ncbi:hypothetical protein C7C46_32020 [Streptomyces tateyamensis]|uniref:Uncharacterized protein n=1 Tax=Streptomyces tateyamensis TaxID=565073 RepID=A0A2V4MSR2_9ACTN|nr:DUF6296 family protein [Streptomyces tateyamensis]PYC65902.1 hypothetical protein C7C46_32020 [Streptomyces tateyamensis]
MNGLEVDVIQRYAVSLPGPVGSHAPARVVVVHWTSARAAGLPVYADEEGDFRVTVDELGSAQLLEAADGAQAQCLHAVPLP